MWLIHNAYRFKNPLEFYNGLGSAKDIYAHQLATTAFPYPTDGSLLLSARYYLEDLKLVIGVWALELAVLGLVAWCASLRESRRGAVAVLFIVPLPFYIQAMAYAAVPLYVPTLFPHTYYNLRYGVEMIAAVALFPSFVFSPRLGKKLRLTLLIVFLAVLGRQFAGMTAAGPRELPVVKEGILNTPCRCPAAASYHRIPARALRRETRPGGGGEVALRDAGSRYLFSQYPHESESQILGPNAHGAGKVGGVDYPR